MLDISRLCPGCMREAETDRAAGMQGGKMRREGKCPYCGFEMSGYKQNARCLPVNTILAGKYLVGAALGQGGFGITYMGYDLNMQARIAIKEYFPVELVSRDTTSLTGDRVISLSGDKSVTYRQGLKKYVEEAQNVSRFSEIPGIVSVKDFFYENETAYIVMEYIDGISLKEYLKECGGRLPEEETLAIMKPVLEALVKVHEAGIVHRDISPDNIMLTFAGGRGRGAAGGGAFGPGMNSKDNRMASGDGAGDRWETVRGSMGIVSVKLIDFGAARMTAKNDQKSLTIILKHGYAPEEQYRTHGEQGPWTDVYAVCAVMYRMLAGQTPPSAMDRLFQDDLKSLEELGVQVDGNTAAAVRKGLAVKKEGRILAMDELIRFLYENKKVFRNGERRNSKTAAVMAAAAGAAILGVAVFFGAGAAGKQNQDILSEKQGLTEGQAAESGETESSSALGESAAEAPAEALTETPAEGTVAFEEERLGETIVYPDPQTSVSVQEQSFALIRMPDGTVKAMGANDAGQCMVEEWADIAAVAAGRSHSLGLRSDGKVFAAGDDSFGQCSVDTWENVVQIAAGSARSFGVTADGHVLACGANKEGMLDDIAQWEDIVAVTAAYNGELIGVDKEGNVHYAGFDKEMPAVTGWQGVKHLSYGRMYGATLIGIKEDGTVLREQLEETNPSVVHFNEEGNWQYAGIEDWSGIRQICPQTPVLGVREDGTVMYLENSDGQMREALGSWRDMEAVASVYSWDRIMVIGVQKNGEILVYRQNYGNADVEDMRDLEWVQAMEETSSGDNLVAKTKDGRILACGLRPFYMEYLLNSMRAKRQLHG